VIVGTSVMIESFFNDRTFRVQFSDFRKLIDVSIFFLTTMVEGSSQVDYPRASHPVLHVVLICMTSIANFSQDPPLKQLRALQTM